MAAEPIIAGVQNSWTTAILEDRDRFAGRRVVTIVFSSNVDLDAAETARARLPSADPDNRCAQGGDSGHASKAAPESCCFGVIMIPCTGRAGRWRKHGNCHNRHMRIRALMASPRFIPVPGRLYFR